ncbi:MAG TPA: hypothetical protein PLI09_14675 [Candidatus Hydrogenedentes bacterium]|nr:hypothetical protein [Candidatus Hydrogenedentota bacterium]
MSMADKGWVWEGQGLDPGVYPSIFGIGEGADFFGLRKVHFLFHETTELALQKLSRFDEVRCDISKWKFRNCGTNNGGSECYADSRLETILAEAEKVSRYSLKFPNVTGGYFDDMKGLMKRENQDVRACIAVKEALIKHNPKLKLESVVYTHELEDTVFWNSLMPYIDVVSLWVWKYQDLPKLETSIEQCQRLFIGKPITMGCYLRDYTTAAPVPMDAIKLQWGIVQRGIEDGRLQGFDILGTVLIEGQLDQATWIRDFIRSH